VEYAWIFLRVMLYFDEPFSDFKYPTNSKHISKKKNLRLKYKVLENCMTKRGIRLYIFTCYQSYSGDIFYKLDNTLYYTLLSTNALYFRLCFMCIKLYYTLVITLCFTGFCKQHYWHLQETYLDWGQGVGWESVLQSVMKGISLQWIHIMTIKSC